MQNSNICFPSSVNNLELLMEAFFPQQHKAHVEAFRYYQNKMFKNARNAAIDACLRAELAVMKQERQHHV